MMAAIDDVASSADVKDQLVTYFVPAADAMRNDGLREFSPPS
jgi:hypothetical protein